MHLGQADAVAGWVARYRVRLDEAPPPAARPLDRRGLARRTRAGRSLPRVAGALREGGRRPAGLCRGGRMGAASAARCDRGGHARADPHRPRRARPVGGRHATATPRARHRARVLGLELPRAPGAAAADRARAGARSAGRPALSPRGGAAPRSSSATGWHRSSTSPTSSSRRSPRWAGQAGPWSCSTGWRQVGLWPTFATRTPAERSASCTPSRRPWPARCCCPGWPRRTATPLSATSGRPWRRCTWPTTTTGSLRSRPTSTFPPTPLVDRALESGDEHAIKLTEAALRSYERSGDPLLLMAAADACDRLGG